MNSIHQIRIVQDSSPRFWVLQKFKRCGTALALILVGFFNSVDSLAQTMDVCDRSGFIQTAIMDQVNRQYDDDDEIECESVPTNYLAEITEIRIDYVHSVVVSQRYTQLTVDDFQGLTGLITLRLNHVRPRDIPDGIFDGLTNLRRLELRGNNITRLPVGLFSELSSIKWLYLNNNSLTTVPEDLFNGLNTLEILNLGDNDLMSLPEDLFDGLSELRSLWLHGNALTSLPDDLFDGLSRLQVLEMNENDISSLQAGLFHGLELLQKVFLKRNGLESIDEDLFDEHPYMDQLELNHNSLTNIPEGLFEGLSGLLQLNVSDNSLTNLPDGLFSGLYNLTDLYLNDNSLERVQEGLFDDLTKLDELKLNNNELTELPERLFDFKVSNPQLELNLEDNMIECLPSVIVRNPYLRIIPRFDPCGLTISLNPSTISENEGVSIVTATQLPAPDDVDTMLEISVAPDPDPESQATVDDYTLSNNITLIIPVRNSRSQGTVRIFAEDNDDLGPPEKEFIVSGSVVQGSQSKPDSVILIIEDDEEPLMINFLLSDNPISENGGETTVSVTLDEPSKEEVIVTVSATPESPEDYALSENIILTIAEGETSSEGIVTITAEDNEIYGPSEKRIIISGESSVSDSELVPPTLTLIIEDDEVQPSVSLALSPEQITENEGVSTVTATLNQLSFEATTVDISAVPVSPASADDYTLSTNTILTIPAMELNSTGTVTIMAINNEEVGPPEKKITVSGASSNADVPEAETLIIEDDDVLSVITFALATSSADEDKDIHDIELTINPAPTTELTANYSLSGSATENSDYSIPNSGSVTIGVGATSANIVVEIDDDDITETDETVIFTLTDQSAYTLGSITEHTLTINDDDPPVISFALVASSANEDQGTHNVALTIDPRPTTQFTANYSLSGSATESSDYSVTNSESVTIAAGETSVNIAVDIVNDNITETDETVIFTLTNQSAYTLGSITAHTLTITDNDDSPVAPTVTFSVDPTTVTEGNTTRLTVTLSEAVSTPTVLELEYEDIDTEPNDYTPLSSLTIAAGALSTTGDLRIDDDEISEPDESFRIRLVKPEGVDLGTPSFVDVTILDNDTAPPTEVILTVDRQSVTEGESVTVTVTLNDALDQAVTIPLDYPTDGASAVANLDYTPLPELTIAAGRTTQSGNIPTLTDAYQEGEETFTVALGALPPDVVGGRVLSHTIIIVDHHQPPEVSLSVDRNPVDEGEITTITVTLSGPLSDDATIPVTLTPVTASREDVEVLTSLSPVITSGETEAEISIRAVDDDLIEGSETFTVALGSLPTTVVEGSPSTLEITINDTDEARLNAPESVVILEGNQETIEVSLTAIPSGQVSVEITGYEGTDLSVSPTTTLVFSPDRWDQPQELTLIAGQDDDFLPDEVFLRMTASGGEYSGVTHTLEVTIIDGNQPGLVVQSSVLINEGGEESFDVRLAQQPTDAVTVLISGTTGTDLVLQSTSVLKFSVSDWDQNQSVDLMAEEDSDADADPPIQLILNASGGGYDGLSETVTVTIQEKDQVGMVVEPTSLRIDEGESDVLSVYLTAQPSENVTVDISGYETSDLMIPSPSVTFTPSDWQISKEFALEAGTDPDIENDEIRLTISATGGGYSGQQEEVQVTIVDQGLPKITIYDAQAKEDDGIIRLPVELSHTTDQVVTVQYSSTDETATAAEDYTSSRGIVIFDPGGTRGIVQFEILPDARVEVTKTFTVTLTGATNAEIVRSSATATIIDDDGGVPTIAIYDAVGSDDAVLMMFEVVLSEPSPHAITVGYRTEDGSAIAGEDYTASSGQVTFARGEMQKTIEVLLLSKDINWQEETFFVHLEASESVQIEKDVATAVIQQPTQVQQNALTAYTVRFIRTLSVQLTEALQERLQPSGSTCSAMERAETAQLWHGTSNWSPSLGELLSGCRISRMDTTSFGRMGFWGRGSFRRFHGRDTDALTLRGDVSTAMMGTDYRWKTGWMAGMMVAYSQGSGTYQHSDEDGEISTQLTGIYPYVSYAASDWEIWMSGGYGWGSAELQDINRDVASRFGAVGFQGDLASVRTSRLRYYGDVLLTDVDIEEHQSEVIRVRLGMESAFHISEWIHPYVEANVRQDGGDAETGIGLELGGGFRIAYPDWKLQGEVRSQGLVLHSADGFMEWGISGSIQIGHPSEGLMMRVRPSWGPNYRMTLYRQQTILDASPQLTGMHRTEVELGYGIPVHDGTVRSIVGVTQLPQGRLLRVGGQLNPWDWVSFTISGLAHQSQSAIGDMSVHVQSTLTY